MKTWELLKKKARILRDLWYNVIEYGAADGTVIRYAMVKLEGVTHRTTDSVSLNEETFWLIATIGDGNLCISISACSDEDAKKERQIMAEVLKYPA